jgi:hypothetical protein
MDIVDTMTRRRINIIKERVLSHIDQVLLDCAIYELWASLISQGVF